ncbi:hypothetical protein SLEP1_g12433 [Rubroshorea leprosula]|uniref:Uncharacterized protein n=1 Tax=Rubroshorea leprosula TaxID=152421 RepID=A0AAV5II87_9ROSI|nr:hypothetical protein SLEP1_g12433 [Rubroshorea leprosula]
MDNFRQQKVQKFEEFVDHRLKPDLVHAIAERDKVFEQQKVFSDLRRNIENLEKNSVTSLQTLVNLGSEVYMQAEVYTMYFCGYWPRFSCGVHMVRSFELHIIEGRKVSKASRGVYSANCIN